MCSYLCDIGNWTDQHFFIRMDISYASCALDFNARVRGIKPGFRTHALWVEELKEGWKTPSNFKWCKQSNRDPTSWGKGATGIRKKVKIDCPVAHIPEIWMRKNANMIILLFKPLSALLPEPQMRSDTRDRTYRPSHTCLERYQCSYTVSITKDAGICVAAFLLGSCLAPRFTLRVG